MQISHEYAHFMQRFCIYIYINMYICGRKPNIYNYVKDTRNL